MTDEINETPIQRALRLKKQALDAKPKPPRGGRFQREQAAAYGALAAMRLDLMQAGGDGAEFGKLEQAKTRQDFLAAAQLLRDIPGGNGRLGVVGFCYGGSMANFLATQMPDLAAAVPFYGSGPALEDVPKIKAELLVVHASNDERINTAWPAYEAALQQAGVRYSHYKPDNTQHGFHNDTTPRFDAAAAKLAWERTLRFFRQHLPPA